MKAYRAQCSVNKAGAERWTDNAWTMKDHLTKKRGLMSKDVDQLLGTGSEAFDDLTFKKQRKKKL
jgi:hypothetical protein